MLEQVQSEEDFPAKKQTLTVGKLFTVRGIPPQNLSEWENKYSAEDPEIRESIYWLKKIMEVRINEGGLRDHLNTYQVIFNLKNNYGWKEEQFVHDDNAKALVSELEAVRLNLAGARALHIKARSVEVIDQPEQKP